MFSTDRYLCQSKQPQRWFSQPLKTNTNSVKSLYVIFEDQRGRSKHRKKVGEKNWKHICVSHDVNCEEFLFEISNTRSSNSGPKPDADIWQSPICVQKNKENPALCTAVIAVYFLAWVRSSWDLIILSVTTELQMFENSTRPWANSSTNNYKRRVQIFKEKEEGNQLSPSLKKKIKRRWWFIAYQFALKKKKNPVKLNLKVIISFNFPPAWRHFIIFRRDVLCGSSQSH